MSFRKKKKGVPFEVKVTLTLHKCVKRYKEGDIDITKRLRVKWKIGRMVLGKTWESFPDQKEKNTYEVAKFLFFAEFFFQKYNFNGYISSFACLVEKFDKKFLDRFIFFTLYEFGVNGKWEKIAKCIYNFGRVVKIDEMKTVKQELKFIYSSKYSKKLIKKFKSDKSLNERNYCSIHFSMFLQCQSSWEKDVLAKRNFDYSEINDDSDQSELGVMSERLPLSKMMDMKNRNKPTVVVEVSKKKEERACQTDESMEKIKETIEKKEIEINSLKTEKSDQIKKYKQTIVEKTFEFNTRKQSDYRKIRSQAEEISKQKRKFEQFKQELLNQRNNDYKKNQDLDETITTQEEKIESMNAMLQKYAMLNANYKKKNSILISKCKKFKRELESRVERENVRKINENTKLKERKVEELRSKSSRNVLEITLASFYGLLCLLFSFNITSNANSLKFLTSVFVLYSSIIYIGFKIGKKLGFPVSYLSPKSQKYSEYFKKSIAQSVLYGVVWGVLSNVASKFLRKQFNVLTPTKGDNILWEEVLTTSVSESFLEEMLVRLFCFQLMHEFINTITKKSLFKRIRIILYFLNFVFIGVISGIFHVYFLGKKKDATLVFLTNLICGIFYSYMYYILEIIECTLVTHTISTFISRVM